MEELRKAFRIYDENDNGIITFQNLKKVALDMEHNISDEEIQEMIMEADSTKSGKVSIDDFMKHMQKAKLY